MKRLLLLFLFGFAFSQGLFESATQTAALNYDLSGNMKTFMSLKEEDDSLIFSNMNAETSLKIKVEKDAFAYAFADIKFLHRTNPMEDETQIILREAYVDISPGIFNFRLGKQILPWGRTDMYKPTDNITPQDLRYWYTDPNDMRLGSFLFNSSVNLSSLIRVQTILIPFYNPDIFPVSLFEFPAMVTYEGLKPTTPYLRDSGLALKFDMRTSHYDVSFSYLNAYELQPAFASSIELDPVTGMNISIFQEPWRQKVYGFDAAFNLNSWAYRFEGTYMHPDESSSDYYTPKPEVQLTLGLDKTSGPLSVLCEYNLSIVPQYAELSPPVNPMLMVEHLLNTYNQLFYRQTDHFGHQILVRTALDLFHETLSIEFPIAYNISTKDYLLSAHLTYHIADAVDIKLGAQRYGGEDNSLFELLKPLYNGYYCELKLSF
ncbi:MAG: hypothetical protein WCT23_05470 [Candidatus Neomarinimicrobiota bacterium]